MRRGKTFSGLPGWLAMLLALLGSAVGIAAAILLSQWILPRGNALVWEWKLREHVIPLLPWVIPSGCLLLLVALFTLDAVRSTKLPSNFAAFLLVCCLMLSSTALMLGFMVNEESYLHRAAACVLSDQVMGYYTQACKITDPEAYLRDVKTRTDLGHVPERVATHPPGPVLYFHWVRGWLFEHPQVLKKLEANFQRWADDPGLHNVAILARKVSSANPSANEITPALFAALILTFCAPLIIPVMFGLGTLSADLRTGLVAAVLATACPALICFNPSIDALPAILTGLIFLCWLWGLKTGGALPGIFAGIFFALGLWWTHGLLVIGFSLVIFTALAGFKSRRWVAPLTGALLGAGIAAVTAYVILGYDPVTSLLRSLQVQQEIMTRTGRPYGPSVLWNLYEYVLFAGPGLVLMGLIGSFISFMKPVSMRQAGALGISLLVTAVLLAVSARTRGEVGRIWGFLMPGLCVPAAIILQPLRSWSFISAGVLVLAGQVALCIMIGTLLQLVSP